MTTEEIKQLIAEKIAGQGSAVDAASILPTVLNGILAAIPELAPIAEAVDGLREDLKYYIASQYFDTFRLSDYASGVEITEELAQKICAGSIFYVDDNELDGKPLRKVPPFNALGETGWPMASFIYGIMEEPDVLSDGSVAVYVYLDNSKGKFYIKAYDAR